MYVAVYIYCMHTIYIILLFHEGEPFCKMWFMCQTEIGTPELFWQKEEGDSLRSSPYTYSQSGVSHIQCMYCNIT